MGEILDLASIKFNIKIKGDLLAVVTLSWLDEFEIRFCRLTIRKDGSLWFQPPALKEFGWAKCFAINDKDIWKAFEQKVIEKFLLELEEKVEDKVYSPKLLEKLKIQTKNETAGADDFDYDEIDKTTT